ncbi:MAG: hypothetical protein QOE92_322 [Chloroflexota bacterium]|nr:hypothetical protein [Chloroflexota bacterium]
MAYLLVVESGMGDKECSVFTEERDAQDAALAHRRGGEDAIVVNTSLATPTSPGDYAPAVPSGVLAFRL